MILITPIHVQYDSFAACSLPPASFKQSQPWASRFERAEGEGGEEAGGDHGGGLGGDCGDHSDGQGDGHGSDDGGDNSGDHGAW